MPVTYCLAGPEAEQFIERIVRKNHPDLEDAGVTFDVLFAHAPRDKQNKIKGHALKTRGFPCAAQVRLNNARARVAGRADVEIVIDGDGWPTWTEMRRTVVLDHELCHISVVHGQTDCALRPKLELLMHDFECCGFNKIIARYGDDALEAQAVAEVVRKLTQQEFGFNE